MPVYVGTERGLRVVDDATAIITGSVSALASAGGSVWAVVDGTQVWRDGARVATAPIEIVSIAADGDVVLLGTAGARLMIVNARSGEVTPVAGFDALDRRAWGTPWGGPPDVMTCAVLDDGAWLAGVHVGGVWRSEDRGTTWREVIALDHDDHQISHVGPVVAVACGGGPIALSSDGGRSFAVPAARGFPHGYGTAVAVGDDAIVLASASGPFAGKSVLHRAPRAARDGAAFVACRTASAGTHRLSASGSVFATVDDDGGVAVSRDAGASWQDVRVPGARCVLVTPG